MRSTRYNVEWTAETLSCDHLLEKVEAFLKQLEEYEEGVAFLVSDDPKTRRLNLVCAVSAGMRHKFSTVEFVNSLMEQFPMEDAACEETSCESFSGMVQASGIFKGSPDSILFEAARRLQG